MKISSTTIFIIFLALLAILLGYNYFATPFYDRFNQEEVVVDNKDLEENSGSISPSQAVFQKLSAEEKIGLLMSYPLTITGDLVPTSESTSATSAASLAQVNQLSAVHSFEPGFVILYGSNITLSQAQTAINDIKELYADIQEAPLFAVDHEGGSVQRLSGAGFTQLPSWQEFCQAKEFDRLSVLTTSATELTQAGVNIVFAPTIDINSAILSSRSCDDYEHTLLSAQNYIEVFGVNQIMPVLKHYPGLGSVKKDLHVASDIIEPTAQDAAIFLQLLELYPTIGIMTSHAQVKNNYDNLPCSISSACVDSILAANQTSLIFSDALEMKAVEPFGELINNEAVTLDSSTAANLALTATINSSASANLPKTEFTGLARISYLALLAGNHVLIYGEGVSVNQLLIVKQQLAELYDQDPTFASKVNESVLKVLSLKY